MKADKIMLKPDAYLLAVALVLATGNAFAEDDSAELAKKLQNPIAALISVPFKVNYDRGIGTDDASQSTYIVQPVIPFALNEDWIVISRTIVPYVVAGSPTAGGPDTRGTGDILQSLFFSPKAPTANGWIWGVGPALSIPSASNDALGTEKWSLGP